MNAGPKKDNLIWIDMEMSGLNPEKNLILEIATIITDSELNVIAEGPDIVISQPPSVLRRMDNWNRKHHKKSGLVQAVKASKISVKQAERMTLKFLKQYCLPKNSPLCGNSVHQDKRFLVKYMPRLHNFLHYRIVDVSSIKDLVRRWYPDHFKHPKKSNCHRALIDIQESIQELSVYRKYYFKRSIGKSRRT